MAGLWLGAGKDARETRFPPTTFLPRRHLAGEGEDRPPHNPWSSATPLAVETVFAPQPVSPWVVVAPTHLPNQLLLSVRPPHPALIPEPPPDPPPSVLAPPHHSPRTSFRPHHSPSTSGKAVQHFGGTAYVSKAPEVKPEPMRHPLVFSQQAREAQEKVLAMGASPELMHQYKKKFDVLDLNKDGVVSLREFAAVSRVLGYKFTRDECKVRQIIEYRPIA